MTIFEPKNYNYRQLEAEKLREKPNFAESWNNEARKPVKSENQTKIGTKTEFYILSSLKIILHLTTVCFNGDFRHVCFSTVA